MNPELHSDLMAALERPHRLGTIGGDLEEQLAHCASFSSVLADVTAATGTVHRAIDLGTGGGLPGVALAMLWPETSWTLVDVRAARAAEVERVVLRLGLGDRVAVVAAEAQKLGHEEGHREAYDVAVARAFGPASLTAECAAGVVKVGGVLVVSEPPQPPEDRWPTPALAKLGFGPAGSTGLDSAGSDNDDLDSAGSDSHFAVMHKVEAALPSLPRLPARSTRGWL